MRNVGKHEYLVYSYSGMENVWLPDRLCGNFAEEELKSLCWRPWRSPRIWRSVCGSTALLFWELLPWFLFALWFSRGAVNHGYINTFVWQCYCFTYLRLIVQKTACFSVDAHTHVHCASWRIFSCSGVCVCLSVRVIQLCAGTAHSTSIDLLIGRGV